MSDAHFHPSHPNSGLFYYRNKTRILEKDMLKLEALERECVRQLGVAKETLGERERALSDCEQALSQTEQALAEANQQIFRANKRLSEMEVRRRLDLAALESAYSARAQLTPFRMADAYARSPPSARALVKFLMAHIFLAYFIGRKIRWLLRRPRTGALR